MPDTLDRLRSALVDRYDLERELGRGGMATVFLAHDIKHGRRVALKVLHPDLAAAIGPERFVQEIAVAARLNHPHILPLLDSGTIDYGSPVAGLYYTMPYVEGETLRARLVRERQLPIEDAVRLGREITDALAYAHEHGVIHRDIKPENILLSNGHAVVADFGIARALTQAGGERVTSTGIALGTPAYMSPEQALAERAIDGRTDIYSLGCVLYEALAGDSPFKGSTAQAILARRMSESAPRLRAVRETVPEAVERAIAKAMAKVPADRFLTAGAFGQALTMATAETTPSHGTAVPGAPPLSGARRLQRAHLLAGLIGAFAGALLAGGIIRSVTRRPDPVRVATARLAIDLPPNDTLVVESGAPAVALSPDGRRLVYVARAGGNASLLFLRHIDRFDAVPIAGTEGASNPVISPNGRWVAFLGDGKLKKVSIDGGQPVTLCAASDPSGFDWESDDDLLLTQFNSPLLRVPAAGGLPRAAGALERGETMHAWPQVVQGGKTVLYTSADASGSRIVAMSLVTRERRVIMEDAAFARYVAGGHLLFVRDGVLLARPFDLNRLESPGTPVPVLEDLQVEDGVVPQMSVSRAGDLVYLAGSGATRAAALVWVDRRGAVTPLPIPHRRYADPRLSPDGRRIAAELGGGEGDIVVLDVVRDRPTRLTFQGSSSSPLWTSDGSRIVFRSVAGLVSNLFIQPADGGAPATRLLENPNGQWPGSVSSDGRTLIYMQSDPRTQGDIWMAPLDGEHTPHAVLRSPATEWGARVSPDGRWLAYVSDELGRFEVYVASFPDPVGKWRISTDGGAEVVWARSGKELFYRHDGAMMAVAVETSHGFSASAPRLLFKGSYTAGAPGLPAYDVAPDGTRFLMLKSDTASAPIRINVVLGWSGELTGTVGEASH